MKVFKLTALALASTLALAGCGSDNDSTTSTGNGSSIPTKPDVDNSLSEIEQAKSIINTAKQFVLDNQAVTDAYKGASDILTGSQEQRINVTFDVPADLSYYMKENNLARLDTKNILALNNDPAFKMALGNISLEPKEGFVATLNAKGQLSVSGTTKVNTKTNDYNDYIFNEQSGQYEPVVVIDNFDVTYNGFENTLSSNTSSTTFNGGFGFNSINIGSGTDAVVFSSNSKGATVSGQFSDKVTVTDEFDLNDINRAGITLEKAVMKLGNVKIQANDSIIEAKDFEVAFLDMSHELADGELVVRTLPSTIRLTGQLIKEKPATDATITLNAVANEADIKNIIKVTADGNIEEAANKFVGMDVVLSLKGNVAKKNAATATTIPLDIHANLKRTARNVIELQGLKAIVDGKDLYVKGKTALDANYKITDTQLTITQNNAVIVLNLDASNDFVKDKMGKLSDIMVNGKDYGDLMDNNGKITAVFPKSNGSADIIIL